MELGRRLPENIGGQVLEYLGSIWRLYCVSMAQKLSEHWANYIGDFSAAFLVMYHHEELLQNPEIRRMKLLTAGGEEDDEPFPTPEWQCNVAMLLIDANHVCYY